MIETINKKSSMEGMPNVGGLLGRFMLEKEIGKGSLGSVYLAHDTLLDVRVALKVISPSLAKTEAFSRLAREVLLARKVSHPGICRIFDIHEVNQYLFISMEYIEGPTLEELVRHNGMLPIDRAARIIAYAARSLAAAHAQGVIHRGLTPSNLVIRAQDRVSIMDFGQALARDMASNKGMLDDKSFVFMSPEILSGQMATQASDIYSLGAILYRCVTGAYPFQGEDIQTLNRAVMSGNIVNPHLFNPQVGQSLENVIVKSMQVRPNDRYHSVLEFKKWITAATGEDAAPEQSVPESFDARAPSSRMERIDQGAVDEFDSADDHTEQVLMEDKTILFSDIVAITKFFDKFGDMAGRKRIQKHNQLLFPVIQRHRGKVIKTIGDAIMAYFVLQDDAVEAAIDMQQVLQKQNSGLVDVDAQIHIRIGLHSGPCIVEDQDVFGDAVNVASRVCGQTEGDNILISADTRDKLLRNRQYTEFFSETKLKGKSDEYSLYSVNWQGVALPDSLLPLADETPKNGPEGLTTSPVSSPFSSPPSADSLGGMSPEGQTSAPPDLSSVELQGVELYPDPLPPSDTVESDEPVLYIPDTEDSVEATVDQEALSPGFSAPALAQPHAKVDTTAVVDRRSAQPARSLMVPFLLLSIVILLLAVAFFAIRFWPNSRDSVENELRSRTDLSTSKNSDSTSSATKDEKVTGTSLSQKPASRDEGDSEDSTDIALVPLVVDKAGSHTSKGKTEQASGASASDVRRLKRSIYSAMKKRGIIVGDCEGVDSELKKMRDFSSSGDFSRALAAGHRAKAAVKAQKIDREFIQAKLLRFNKAFDKVSDSPDAQKVMDLAQDIMSSVESGNFEHANVLLNRSFKIIRSVKQ